MACRNAGHVFVCKMLRNPSGTRHLGLLSYFVTEKMLSSPFQPRLGDSCTALRAITSTKNAITHLKTTQKYLKFIYFINLEKNNVLQNKMLRILERSLV